MRNLLQWELQTNFKNAVQNWHSPYVNDSIKKRVLPLAEKCNSNLIFECDVQNDESIDNFFKYSKKMELN